MSVALLRGEEGGSDPFGKKPKEIIKKQSLVTVTVTTVPVTTVTVTTVTTMIYIKKNLLKCHTRVIRKVIRKSHTRRSYTEVIRGAVFQWVLAAWRKPYAKAIRENNGFF